VINTHVKSGMLHAQGGFRRTALDGWYENEAERTLPV